MFKLAKTLGSDLRYEVVTLKNENAITYTPGCVLICTEGSVASAEETSAPEYIAFAPADPEDTSTVTAMIVTDGMIFKTEYVGNTSPYVGMTVGLAKKNSEMDSVCHNENGAGTVTGVDENQGYVYVKFHK